jgi:chromatin segregation and condensation protein Rec8/ScpA/Scc1 (kleisin family)
MEEREKESVINYYNALLELSKKKGLNLSQQEIFAHAITLESAAIVARSNYGASEKYY